MIFLRIPSMGLQACRAMVKLMIRTRTDFLIVDILYLLCLSVVYLLFILLRCHKYNRITAQYKGIMRIKPVHVIGNFITLAQILYSTAVLFIINKTIIIIYAHLFYLPAE